MSETFMMFEIKLLTQTRVTIKTHLQSDFGQWLRHKPSTKSREVTIYGFRLEL